MKATNPFRKVSMFLAAIGVSGLAAFGGGQYVAAQEDEDEDCLECAQGAHANCASGDHKAANGSPEWNRKGGSHPDTCWPGTCTQKHGTCWDLDLQLEAIEAAVEIADAATLVRLVETDMAVSMNVRRSAIQVRDCANTVVASFPIASGLFETVSSLAALEGVQP